MSPLARVRPRAVLGRIPLVRAPFFDPLAFDRLAARLASSLQALADSLPEPPRA